MKKPTLHQRLKAKNRTRSLVVGLTWYNEQTWLEVKNKASDPECFEASFEEWKAMAVTARREFQRSGVLTLECLIVPQELFDWCASGNKENNAAARGEFVSEKLSAAQGKP